jgi:hypothetical protein
MATRKIRCLQPQTFAEHDDLIAEEIAIIDSFVLKERRQRLRFLISAPDRRCRFLRELAHFKWLDERRVRTISAGAQNADAIAGLLKLKGAPDKCFIVSEDFPIDRKRLPLTAALEQVIGSGMGRLSRVFRGASHISRTRSNAAFSNYDCHSK